MPSTYRIDRAKPFPPGGADITRRSDDHGPDRRVIDVNAALGGWGYLALVLIVLLVED